MFDSEEKWMIKDMILPHSDALVSQIVYHAIYAMLAKIFPGLLRIRQYPQKTDRSFALNVKSHTCYDCIALFY